MKLISKEHTVKKYYRKAKQFVADHDEEIVTGTIITLYTAAAAAMGYYIVKQLKEQKAVEEWTKNKNLEGMIVYQLGNGDYLATKSIDTYR